MIDYMKLAQSVAFYERLGFVRMEAPWWVSKEVLDVTTPPHIKEVYYLPNNRKCLVASGEQSFLYMAAKGRLPKGRFQTITPCFRDESIGILSKKCFMKNELIITDKVDEEELQRVIKHAYQFFSTQVPNVELLEVIKLEETPGIFTYDITYDGIEVGSYGIRSCEFLDWIYATGCAEPRLTRAIRISEWKRSKSQSDANCRNFSQASNS